MLKAIAQRIGLILLGVLFAFIIGEIGVRVLGFAPSELYTYDPYVGWKLKPNASGWQTHEGRAFVSINSDGFRGPDYSIQKPPGTLRVAVVGDSFTEGQQVPFDDTFCMVAQKILQAHCPFQFVGKDGKPRIIDRVEVMNFGCDGYGTAQELITLKRWAWKYSPDIVVLMFFNGNDMRNNSVVLEGDKCRPFYVYHDGKFVLGGPFEDDWLFRAHCMMRFESRHSRLLDLIGAGKKVLVHIIRAPYDHVQTRKNRKHPPHGVELGLNDVIFAPPKTPVWVDAWRVTDAEVEMMNENVKRHGAIFILATAGTGIQDDPSAKMRENYMKYVGATNLFYPDDHLKALGEKDGFDVLNLPEPMQAYAQAHNVSLHGFPNTSPGVGHWNEIGHRLAGELLAQRIRTLIEAQPAATAPSGPDSTAAPK
ncbi:SGNH/GDSL hydrolase family protein [bacterium]|nr:SGNH/GDSL hydrolase family protein [bacterium]